MLKKLYFLTLIFFTAAFCSGSYAQEIISSFENESDLKSIKRTNEVNISQSVDYPALAVHSVKTIFPSQGGAIHLTNLAVTDWSRQEALLLFIWSENRTLVNLIIEDSLHHSFTKPFTIKPGVNHVQLPLSELKKLHKENITSIGISTNQNSVFYLDYVCLDQLQPVLAKDGRWDINYSAKIKTPHIPWGFPLEKGRIKTYSISPIFDGRGIIELAERLDIDFKTTTIGRYDGINRWGFGDFYNRRNPLGDDAGNPYSLAFNYIADDLLFGPDVDVIIWPGLHPWESYPQYIRDAVLKRVSNGTGLLLLYPDSDSSGSQGLWSLSPLKRTDTTNLDKMEGRKESIVPFLDTSKWVETKQHYITRGILFGAFPWKHMGVLKYQNQNGDVLLNTANGNPVLSVGTYGKGRVAAMSYPERAFIPQIDNPWETGLNYPYWEYMWSMVARSAVWAAKKEPETFINKAIHTTDGLTAYFTNIPAEAVLKVQINNDFGTIEQELNIPLSRNQNFAKIKFNKILNGGNHIVNFQLKGKKGVFDWYSLPFQTEQPAQIAAIQNTETEIPVGKDVRTSVSLKAIKPVKGSLIARLFDNYNRLVDEHTIPVSFQEEKTYPVVFTSKNIMTHLGRTDFLLQINGNQADRKVQEFFFLQPRKWDDYDVTMYHFGPNPVPGTWSAIDTQLQQLHLTTMAAYTLANSKHANYKVQAQTRIHGMESPDNGPDLEYYEAMKKEYLATRNKKLLVRKYGLNDSAYLRSVRNELKEKIPAWRNFSPSAYYIYEEPSITRYDDALDLDFSDTALKAFRTWLTTQYASLKMLNNQWGTNFTKWQDVVPDDSYEAQKRGNYSSWADHRSFMEYSWASQFKFVQNIVHDLDSGGLVQLSGTQAAGAHNGYDYSRLNKYVGQMNPYDIGNQLEYHHTFNSDLKISGQAGYGVLGKDALYDAYQHLFLKETGGAYIFWQQSILNPDLTFCQSGLDIKKGFDEMRAAGIGKLISTYTPENESRIAIHYSYPSIHGAWIVDGKIHSGKGFEPGPGSKTLEQFRRNLDGWVKVLHDAGLGFEFCAYSGIENGDLISKDYKVLILPMSVALSDKEAAQIQAFVKAGGILIADALPGVMDEHTKFRTQQALAEVFGTAPQPFTKEDLITPKKEIGLKIAGADYLEKENNNQELLYHSYGKGRAYFLNYFLNDYPEEKLKHTNNASLAKIKKIFVKESLTSGITLTDESGKAASSIAKYSFSEDSSATRLLGLLPDKNSTDSIININLKESVYLYDIRNKKYLGNGKSFRIKVEPAVPRLFGLVQNPIETITALPPSEVKRGEEVVVPFHISGKEKFNLNSIARVDVFNAKDKAVEIYSDNCVIRNNAGSFRFRTALNDSPGNWRVRITEIISGLKKEIIIPVK